MHGKDDVRLAPIILFTLLGSISANKAFPFMHIFEWKISVLVSAKANESEW